MFHQLIHSADDQAMTFHYHIDKSHKKIFFQKMLYNFLDILLMPMYHLNYYLHYSQK